MRNVFDQYSQPENRATHALMTALNEDRRLLGSFLRDIVKAKPPIGATDLLVLEQQFPGEDEAAEDSAGKRGIPDGWIFDETSGWAVLIETKVMAPLETHQIARHLATAERRGFTEVTAVALAPYRYLPDAAPTGTVMLEWRQVYAWLHRHSSDSSWARKAEEYLEILEAKLIDTQQFVEGSLTMFAGFPFSHDRPYSYLEGKRLLKLAIDELRERQDLVRELGMNPTAPGRKAITGSRDDHVWDFLSLAAAADDENFTSQPHLTLGVLANAVEAMVTVPHRVNNVMRRNIVDLGEEGFRLLIARILENLTPLLDRHEGAVPWLRGVQRRYPSQRSKPFIDAEISFDLRTAVPSSGPPKSQPRWLAAAYGSFVNKEYSNFQMQLGVLFPYDRCSDAVRDPAIIDLLAAAWLACKPLVDLARATTHDVV